MHGFTQWLGQLRLDWIWNTLILVASSLLCITVHETCHGYAAYFLGDPTAKRMGRLSFNPLHHIEQLAVGHRARRRLHRLRKRRFFQVVAHFRDTIPRPLPYRPDEVGIAAHPRTAYAYGLEVAAVGRAVYLVIFQSVFLRGIPRNVDMPLVAFGLPDERGSQSA